MNNSYDYLFSVYLKIKDEIPTEKFSCRVVSPTWGEILLEKSKDTSSPYGRSQAIKWKDVPEKFRKSFKVVKENCNNPHKVTPDQLLKEMGKEYKFFKDNCQDAADRGWNLWHDTKNATEQKREVKKGWFGFINPYFCTGTIWKSCNESVPLN